MEEDEYFDDDFLLDDAVLHALNETEAKFSAESQFKRSLGYGQSRPVDESKDSPPKKRLKTAALRPIFGEPDPIDDVNPPEIVLLGESGMYGIAGRLGAIQKESPIYLQPRATTSNVKLDDKNQSSLSVSRPSLAQHAEVTGNKEKLLVDGNDMGDDILRLKDILRNTEEAMYVKDGEISNLRRSLEQRRLDHLEEISRLKQQRLHAEEMKDKVQAELAEEMLRMKNRLAFKQSELESSNRKTSISRVVYSQHMNTAIERSTGVDYETTSRKARSSPKKLNAVERSKTSQPSFPNFQNAFIDSSPPTRFNKVLRENRVPSPNGNSRPLSTASPSRLDWVDMDIDDPARDSGFQSLNKNENILIGEVDSPITGSGFSSLQEMRHILFSHSASKRSELTIQILMSLTPSLEDKDIEHYGRLCRSVIQTFATERSKHDREEIVMAADFLSEIGAILLSANKVVKIEEISSLLQLMAQLSLAVPMFRDGILRETTEKELECKGLKLLKGVFLYLWEGSDHNRISMSRQSLAHSVLDLLENVYWISSDFTFGRFATLIQMPEFVNVLTHTEWPAELFTRAIGFLSLMACRMSAELSVNGHSSLLLTEQDVLGLLLLSRLMGGGPHPSKSYIDILCAKLADSFSPLDEEQFASRTMLLTLISSLCLTGAGHKLAENHSIVPSLVITLSSLTTLIWEEDEAVVDAPPLTSRVVKLVYRVVLLMHYIMFCLKPPDGSIISSTLNLRHILSGRSGSRTVVNTNGMGHYFVVAMGRLCHGVGPLWMNQDARDTLESVCDMAHDLMEFAVEGPEEELIWLAFNDSEEEEPIEISHEDRESRDQIEHAQ